MPEPKAIFLEKEQPCIVKAWTPTAIAYGASIPEAIGRLIIQNPEEFNVITCSVSDETFPEIKTIIGEKLYA